MAKPSLRTRSLAQRALVPLEVVEQKIFLIRGQKVMLSPHLAELYKVEPRVLIQAVKRNIERFPADFMFQLEQEELANLKSQIVISSWGGARHPPFAFTEQGVAMLSSVLKSRRAVEVNIWIMRAFMQLRQILAGNRDLARRLETMEQKYDKQFQAIFDILRQLMNPKPRRAKRPIGFVAGLRRLK